MQLSNSQWGPQARLAGRGEGYGYMNMNRKHSLGQRSGEQLREACQQLPEGESAPALEKARRHWMLAAHPAEGVVWDKPIPLATARGK